MYPFQSALSDVNLLSSLRTGHKGRLYALSSAVHITCYGSQRAADELESRCAA